MTPANDNIAPISGKAARAWPAMTTAIRNDDIGAVRALARFARLYELANSDLCAIPSPAGMYKDDGDLALVDLVDEVAPDENGEPGNPGYGIDCCMRDATEVKRLVDVGALGAHTRITAKGKAGSERTPNFRIRHVWRNQKVDGEITQTFYTVAEHRTGGKWWPVRGERFYAPRGPDRDDDDSLTWTHTVHSSGKVGATYRPCVAEDRALAIIELEHLRAVLGDDLFDALRRAAVERLTAKPLSALGGNLIESAVAAANDNWKFANTGWGLPQVAARLPYL